MPGDEAHVAWSERMAFVAGVVLYASGVELLYILGMVGVFLFGAKYVSPDLDIQSKPYHRWGIFRILWYPFLKLVPHRSKWSHHIILGPISVVAYFMLLVLIACEVLNTYWLPVVEPMIDQAQELLRQIVTLSPTHDNAVFMSVVIVCLLAAAAWHITLDIIMKGDREA